MDRRLVISACTLWSLTTVASSCMERNAVSGECIGDADACRNHFCDPNPCGHGGACTEDAKGFTCNCAGTGYEGTTCEHDVDECIPVQVALNVGTNTPVFEGPCKNGGTCTDGVASFTCDCAGTGYDGATCTADVNECNTNNGNCAHTCTNSEGSYTCSCSHGYSTNDAGVTCIDIDDCSPNPCLHEGTCTDTGVDSYTCDCASGYDGDLCENDVNDFCIPNPCNNGGTCEHGGPGDWSDKTQGWCECGNAYEGNWCDTDVNECIVNHSACTNHDCGSVVSGWDLYGDPYNWDPIVAICKNNVGGYTCTCPNNDMLIDDPMEDSAFNGRTLQNGAQLSNGKLILHQGQSAVYERRSSYGAGETLETLLGTTGATFAFTFTKGQTIHYSPIFTAPMPGGEAGFKFIPGPPYWNAVAPNMGTFVDGPIQSSAMTFVYTIRPDATGNKFVSAVYVDGVLKGVSNSYAIMELSGNLMFGAPNANLDGASFDNFKVFNEGMDDADALALFETI